MVEKEQPDIEAYTRYLSARFQIHQQTPESLRRAIQQLRELVVTFPDYAPAYSGIAAANGLLCVFGVASGREIFEETKELPSGVMLSIRRRRRRAPCWVDFALGSGTAGGMQSGSMTGRFRFNPDTPPLMCSEG